MSDDYVLLTEAEVAKMLRMATKTLQKRRCEKRPPAYVKLNGVIRYRASDVKAYIDSSLTPANGVKNV